MWVWERQTEGVCVCVGCWGCVNGDGEKTGCLSQDTQARSVFLNMQPAHIQMQPAHTNTQPPNKLTCSVESTSSMLLGSKLPLSTAVPCVGVVGGGVTVCDRHKMAGSDRWLRGKLRQLSVEGQGWQV